MEGRGKNRKGVCDSFLLKALYRHLSQETKAHEVWDKTASWIDLDSFVICKSKFWVSAALWGRVRAVVYSYNKTNQMH